MILDFEKLFYPSEMRASEQRKRQHYDLDRMRKAYREVFLSENGKVVLEDIAKRGLLHTMSFTGAASGTDFNEGKRALALEIIHLLNPDPIRIGDLYDGTSHFDSNDHILDTRPTDTRIID
jgi:hypothetical protein